MSRPSAPTHRGGSSFETGYEEDPARDTPPRGITGQQNLAFPSFSQVIDLDQPKSQIEWCLVCAIYCAREMGVFTESNVLARCRSTGRCPATFHKNLRRNMQLLVGRELLQKNGELFTATPMGEDAVHAILKREVVTI